MEQKWWFPGPKAWIVSIVAGFFLLIDAIIYGNALSTATRVIMVIGGGVGFTSGIVMLRTRTNFMHVVNLPKR